MQARISRLLLTSFILLFCINSLTGCTGNNGLRSIYSDNKRLTSQGDSYSFGNRIGDTKAELTELEYSRFFGADTIFFIEVEKSGEIRIDYDSVLSKGKFKAVIISPDDEVLNVFEHEGKGDTQQGTYTLNARPGVYRLKIVGDNATGKLKLQSNLDENMKMLTSAD